MSEYGQALIARTRQEQALRIKALIPHPRPVPEQFWQRVYVVSCREFVKVGIARDPARRWRNLRIGNPLIEPLAYESALLPRACLVETKVHHELDQYWVIGEWFRCSVETAIAAVQRLMPHE